MAQPQQLSPNQIYWVCVASVSLCLQSPGAVWPICPGQLYFTALKSSFVKIVLWEGRGSSWVRATHPLKVHHMDLKMILRLLRWNMMSASTAYFTSNDVVGSYWTFWFTRIFFFKDLLQTLFALDCAKPGSQWAFGENSSGIEWSVTRPWLTLSMEEASQTCCQHLVQRAAGPLRRERPSTSSATGPQTWEASVQV